MNPLSKRTLTENFKIYLYSPEKRRLINFHSIAALPVPPPEFLRLRQTTLRAVTVLNLLILLNRLRVVKETQDEPKSENRTAPSGALKSLPESPSSRISTTPPTLQPQIESRIERIGRKRAITIKPTIKAKNTIMIGSMIEVIDPTVLSTSSS